MPQDGCLLLETDGVAPESGSVVRLPLDGVAEAIDIDYLEEGYEVHLLVGDVSNLDHGLGPFWPLWDSIGRIQLNLQLREAHPAAPVEATQARLVEPLH